MMKRKKKPGPVDLQVYRRLDQYHQNRQLFEWLSDDARRAELYAVVSMLHDGVLKFPSLVSAADDDEARLGCTKNPVRDTRYRDAYLLTSSDTITRAMTSQEEFSNSPYAALGDGTFMLALDDTGPAVQRRKLQRCAATQAFRLAPEQINALCRYACEAASSMSLSGNAFDLADFAEQAALRFASALFGFTAADYPLLEETVRKGYRALNYQILGRHFVNEPLTLSDAQASMARLLARTMQLLEEYAQSLGGPPYAGDPPDDIEGSGGGVPQFTRVLEALAHDTSDLTSEERAVLVIGSLVGIVGNVQASSCIAMQALFARQLRDRGLALARTDGRGSVLWPLLAEGLRLNPPVAFLPRRTLKPVPLGKEGIAQDALCILALGGATRGSDPNFNDPPVAPENPLIFGLDANPGRSIHWCIGKYLAIPLIETICADVLRLPSLAERLDADDGLPIGLDKQWGFRCLKYPLQHRRDLRFKQQSLNVVMRIKTPTAANAEALRRVIRYGAPRIERVLRESRHVHFAWFEFIESDTRLVLHTVFDGDFNAYLQHFALVVGEVFDRLFQYIEDAPPAPVNDHPNEFVDTIRRFHRPTAEGFFFSAYPRTETAQVTRWSRSRP
jgi:cytochrome P450